MIRWPLVHAALIELWSGIADLDVWDGPAINQSVSRDYVCVGWDEDGQDIGSFTTERSELGNTFLVETGAIRSSLIAQDGGRRPGATRTRAFALAERMALAVSADHTLGVLPQGSTCSVEFVVNTPSGSQGLAVRLDLITTYTAPF